MKNCCTQDAHDSHTKLFEPWAPDRLPDPADAPKPTWRDALRLVAAPAARLHHYRKLRAAMIRAAMDNLERDGTR